MSKQTVLETESATLWFHPEHKIVHHQIRQFIYGEEFRNLLMKGLELFKKHGCDKWLSDDRGLKATHPDDTAWGRENWIPQVMAAGWRHWALVVPDMSVSTLAHQRLVMEFSKYGVTVELFEDVNQALAWLTSK